MESCTLLGQLGYLALVALFPMCSRSLEGSDLSGGSLGLLRDRAVTFTCSFYITSMSLDTQAFHPQASQTKARLPDSLPPCHTGSWLWITYLAVLPSLPRYPPDALPTSLSHPKTEGLGVEVERQQRWDVREGLKGWITGIGDHTNYMVSMTTGCQFELRPQSVVTDCHNKVSVSGPTVF